MRNFAVLLFLCSAISIPALAASMDDDTPDQRSIDALQRQAEQAPPREQYFLYAQLVHQMVEFSAQQFTGGDVEHGQGLLKEAQSFIHRIRMDLAKNDKKLKKSEILLRQSAFLLGQLLHSSDLDDRPIISQTLAELNQVQTDAMLQVFRK